MDPFELPPEIFGQVPLFAELSKAMSWTGGPVNWDIARQIATALARSDQSPPIIDEDRAELADALRLTGAWLVEATGLPEPPTTSRLVVPTPQEWVERALSVYPEVVEPLAAKLSNAVTREAPEGDEEPLAKVVGQLIPLFLGIQAGTVIGGLARSVWTGYDVPVPIEEDGAVTIVVPHVDAHAHEFGIDRRDLRYWVTLRTVTVSTLFDGLPWTRTHFFSLYHQYLAGVDVDLSDTLERLTGLDISSPDQLQEALGSGVFGLSDAPAAGPALASLQRYMALLDATADEAVARASAGKLTEAARIAESVARRRSRGDAASMLAKFLGLDVPGDTARAASAFCRRVLEERGWPGIIGMWTDTDRVPSAAELGDPDTWMGR